MTTNTLTAQTIRDAELRARQMRSEAFATFLRAAFRAVFARKSSARAAFTRPAHG